MLPRHHTYLNTTMLPLAATMSEEDSPLETSPEPDERRWRVWGRTRHEQRVNKKARAKRKAKKGWT